jgi:hypothetical protein
MDMLSEPGMKVTSTCLCARPPSFTHFFGPTSLCLTIIRLLKQFITVLLIDYKKRQ